MYTEVAKKSEMLTENFKTEMEIDSSTVHFIRRSINNICVAEVLSESRKTNAQNEDG